LTIPEASGQPIAEIQHLLRALFGTIEPVAIVPASGRIGLEMLLRAAVLHRAAVLVRGGQGETLARTAESLGKEVVRIVSAEDLPVDADQVERFLSGPEMDALLVELGSGTSGSPALLEQIGRLVRRRRGMVLVADATDTLGRMRIEMDRWGVDAVFAASDGALGLPPGLGLLAMSGRLLQRLHGQAGRGRLLDPVAHQAAAVEGRLAAPVTTELLEALQRRLDELVSPRRP